MGCDAAYLLRVLPDAAGGRAIRWRTDAACEIDLGAGAQVALTWQALPPRRIALLRIERLQLDIEFSGTTEPQRRAFLDYFDAYTRRGGG